jgi:hypothetical protein
MDIVRLIIVNYATPGCTLDALESVEKAGSELSRVHAVVIDNCSPDDSVKILQEQIRIRGWSRWVRLVTSDRNGGFGFGNNLGMSFCADDLPTPAFFWLLNPDTLVARDSLDAMLSVMRSQADVGMVGSRLLNRTGGHTEGAHNFPSPISELVSSADTPGLHRRFPGLKAAIDSPELTRCDWVCGASMLLRARMFDSVETFDEGFFLYFEEVELAARAAKAGWAVAFEPKSTVTHFGQASTNIDGAGRFPWFWFASRRRFFVKTYGWFGLAVADALWLLGWGIRRTRRRFVRSCSSPPFPVRYGRDLLGGDIAAWFRSALSWEAESKHQCVAKVTKSDTPRAGG